MNSKFYTAICCQMDCKNAKDYKEVKENAKHACWMIDNAVEIFEPHIYPKLIVFPENMQGFPYLTAKEHRQNMAIEIPGEITDIIGEKAKQYDLYIAAGSWYEKDSEWKHGLFFNTFPLIAPNGKVILKYRKVNPWIPNELSCSPHDLLDAGYKEELFPVAKTDIGNIGLYICYDGCFPEVARELTYNGAEILIRCSAYMDPWGDVAWYAVNVVRAFENIVYHICCNQGASMQSFPPCSWPGRSMIVDFEGRVLAEAGSGERIIGAPINIDMLREYREKARLHNHIALLRDNAYTYLRKRIYSGQQDFATLNDINLKEYDMRVKKQIEKFVKEYQR